MKATVMIECPKCCGSGYLPHYAGIANGVCFRCTGAGKVAYRKTKQVIPPLTEYQAGKIEEIKTGDMAPLSYGKLAKLRDFAYGPTAHCPELLTIWRERGESHFQEAQQERLASLREGRSQ